MNNIMYEFSMPFFEFHMSYKDVKHINLLNKEFWKKVKIVMLASLFTYQTIFQIKI